MNHTDITRLFIGQQSPSGSRDCQSDASKRAETEGRGQITVNALTVCYVSDSYVQCCGFNILCNYL